MQTRVWGPTMWFFLHTMAANYPVTPTAAQRRDHVKFLGSLGAVLPCRHYRDNFRANLTCALRAMRAGRRVRSVRPRRSGRSGRKTSLSRRRSYNKKISAVRAARRGVLSPDHPAMSGRESFFEFIWRLHGAVSSAISAGEYTAPPLTKMRQEYEGYRSRCNTARERRQVVGEPGCTEPVPGQTKGQCKIRVVNHAAAPAHSIQDDRWCTDGSVDTRTTTW